MALWRTNKSEQDTKVLTAKQIIIKSPPSLAKNGWPWLWRKSRSSINCWWFRPWAIWLYLSTAILSLHSNHPPWMFFFFISLQAYIPQPPIASSSTLKTISSLFSYLKIRVPWFLCVNIYAADAWMKPVLRGSIRFRSSLQRKRSVGNVMYSIRPKECTSAVFWHDFTNAWSPMSTMHFIQFWLETCLQMDMDNSVVAWLGLD